MSEIEQVSYTEFRPYLRETLAAYPKGFVIGLCVDDAQEGANVILKANGKIERWRVGANGGKIRIDNWTVVGYMEQQFMGTGNHFPDPIQELFEKAINDDKRGYVWLTIKNRRIQSGERTDSL